MTDGFVAFGSQAYMLWLGLLTLGRGLDLFSTWLATPNLELEANPIARRLGWRGGLIVNLLLVSALAAWPFSALMVSTTSLLVAARNFQSAWLMRTMGEHAYMIWMSDQVARTPPGRFFFCLAVQTLTYAGLGLGLAVGAWDELIPVGIGCGMAAYGIALFVYSGLSVWRVWRRRV
ncbi:MAG: hypothetical protein FJ404_13260 [Verrucomicrobia bacterium]|nr:hypothetical protein [Verrucomicrobiota bacterium]